MVLIAQLATTGKRADLSQLADDVFQRLVDEFKAQGLTTKAIADLFGLSLRTYHNRAARPLEHGRSLLYERLLEYIRANSPADRASIEHEFRRDDPLMVAGVLAELQKCGIVYVSGTGKRTRFKFDARACEPEDDAPGIDELVRVVVFRLCPVSSGQVAATVRLDESRVDAALERLVRSGRVQSEVVDGVALYSCDQLDISLDAEQGWEAAVFDHYQAVVQALVRKLRNGQRAARAADRVGGLTYLYGVWPGHPLEDEVFSSLSRVRTAMRELRDRVERYNASHPVPATGHQTVIFYAGQTYVDEDALESD